MHNNSTIGLGVRAPQKPNLYHQIFRVTLNDEFQQEFDSLHALFDFSPNDAAWFAQHPYATFLTYDHGRGLIWTVRRIER